MDLIANQTKYVQTKAVNFIIDWWSLGFKIIIYKYIQLIMKGSLLQLKNLLKPYNFQIYDFSTKKCSYWYIRWHSNQIQKLHNPEVKSILTLVLKIMIKTLNLRLVTMKEYQNSKIFLQKTMFQIGRKRCFWLKKFKRCSAVGIYN